ncbi:MAG: hypothetical protein WBQ73_01195 [Candidatus Babeliales bacterium]
MSAKKVSLVLSLTLCLSTLNLHGPSILAIKGSSEYSLDDIANLGRSIGQGTLWLGRTILDKSGSYIRPQLTFLKKQIERTRPILGNKMLNAFTGYKSRFMQHLSLIRLFKKHYEGHSYLLNDNLPDVNPERSYLTFFDNLKVKAYAFTKEEQQTCMELLYLLYFSEVITDKQFDTLSRIIITNIHTQETQTKVKLYILFYKAFTAILTTKSFSFDYLHNSALVNIIAQEMLSFIPSMSLEPIIALHDKTIIQELFAINSSRYLPQACRIYSLHQEANELIDSGKTFIKTFLDAKHLSSKSLFFWSRQKDSIEYIVTLFKQVLIEVRAILREKNKEVRQNDTRQWSEEDID